MNNVEDLQPAQDVAKQLLIDNFDHKLGFPPRATSGYGDLWPGDRWTEAYLAIDENQMARRSFEAVLQSVTNNHRVPHLMQGSHRRLGLE